MPPATRTPATCAAGGRWLSAGGVGVLDAHRVHVDAFAREAEAAAVAPATLARRLTAMAGFYGYAVDEGLIARSPVARVRRPKVSDESPRLGFDRDELRAVLAAAEAYWGRVLHTACAWTTHTVTVLRPRWGSW